MLRHLRFVALIALAPVGFLLVFWLIVGAPLHTPPRPAEERAAAEPLPLSSEQTDMILDLFNPSEGLADHQKNSAALAERLEQSLTIAYMLRGCDHLSESEYTDTYRAIVAYATRMNLAPTPEAIQERLRSITESANASYALIYSRTDCSDPKLDALTDQIEAWSQAMLKAQP